ncbi:MAG TPA: cysteine--tRNA ligase [Terriglobia bacterium]|nr:cysteine--tRNA ligase [Terriglobia bacterium]
MALQFHNTLSGSVEEFRPLEDRHVRIYTCGPTVYDFAHIGNYRTFVAQDILRRWLKYRGFDVKQVMNLTDVDDKTIRNSNAAGLPLRDYTQKYIDAFMVDRDLLGLDPPEVMVRATDTIEEMVKLIEALEQKGFAYQSDGSVYYRVQAFKDYGKLSKINLSGNRAGARVDSDEYEKNDARDFVLWKAAKDGEPSWPAPFGAGRPGWHIECSAMSMKFLGNTFDIHSGGTDLIFPHHENEIAQSEAATGQPFVRYWLHVEHLMVNGQKMSKSVGNFFTLRDLIAKGFKPSAIRYLLASVPYNKPLNFTFDGIAQAMHSIARLAVFRKRLEDEMLPAGENPELIEKAQIAQRSFEDALDNNLNTAEALAAVFELVTEGNTAMDHGQLHDSDKTAFLDVLKRWDQIFNVLGDNDYEKLKKHGFIREVKLEARDDFHFSDAASFPVSRNGEPEAGTVGILGDEEIDRLITDRNAARRSGKYAQSDQVRDQLAKSGVILEDTKGGTRWRRK